MVKRGGLLILSSPYTWKEEHTEVDKWIGGNYRDAEKCFTERGLETIVRGKGLALRDDKNEFSDVTLWYFQTCMIKLENLVSISMTAGFTSRSAPLNKYHDINPGA